MPQPNALFTAYNPGWIALGAGGSTGRLQLAQGNLEYLRQLDSYRVLSPVPRLSPVSLRGDVVDTSDGAFLTQPRVPERVRLLTEEIIEGAVTDYDKAARIERFLLESYPYDLTVSPYREDEDSVDRFLFVDQAGYCSQFATAMAVMGRLAGLPTRVAVGYLPGKYNSLTGTHAVRVQDAHAWVEVRFKRFGWVPFDPTPHPDSPWALGKGSSSLARGIQQTLRSAIGGFTIDAPSAAAATLGSVLGGLPTVAAVALMIGVVIGLLLLPLRWLRGRVGGSGGYGTPAYSALPGHGREEMRRVYQEGLRLLRKHGLPSRQAHQGVQEYLAAVSTTSPKLGEALRRLTGWTAAAAYNPAVFSEKAPEEARLLLKEMRRGIGSS